MDINWKLIGKGSLEKTPNSDKTNKDGNSNIIYKPDKWCQGGDLNSRPPAYETSALAS